MFVSSPSTNQFIRYSVGKYFPVYIISYPGRAKQYFVYVWSSMWDPFQFDSGSPKIKMDPGHEHFFTEEKVLNYFSFFCSLLYMLKLDETVQKKKFFIISFISVSDFGEQKDFFYTFLLIFCPLDPGPWIPRMM